MIKSNQPSEAGTRHGESQAKRFGICEDHAITGMRGFLLRTHTLSLKPYKPPGQVGYAAVVQRQHFNHHQHQWAMGKSFRAHPSIVEKTWRCRGCKQAKQGEDVSLCF